MSYEAAQNTNSLSGVMLGSRIEIYPSMPLPELDSLGGKAYAARYKADATSSLYAIICAPGIPPRIDAVASMRGVDNPGVVRLIEGGVVGWIDGTHAYALAFQKPTAPRMMTSLDETRAPLNEDAINHHFITPMIDALTALTNFGVVHNAIRPTNIFWRIGNAAPPQIGECLSSPAGLGQPIIFEPIERALAMPLGRGTGVPADDCYAFGVTLAFLVLGRNPLQGLDDKAIIDMKMSRGSFGAIVGSQRLSPTHIEILRGLLADDQIQRWTASDLDQWQNGRRMTPKSSDAGRRAARHFDFMGNAYWQVAPLACALAGNVPEATKVIENESLNKWLRRAMNDKDRAKDLEDVINDLKQSGKTSHYEDQLVARVCIALDHSAPIRYRGLSVMPSGIATMLVDAMQSGNNLQALSEIVSSQLVLLWIQMQGDVKADYIAMSQLFDRMKGLIEKTSFGNGVERAIYEANQGLPCLSPMLRNQYVTSPKTLLAALERVAASGNKPREPMDRHIAAFLIARERRGESAFAALAAPEGSLGRGLALLSLLAELQYRHGPENTPALAAWIAPVADPALKRFLGKALRESLQKQAKEAINAGNLIRLLQIIDDTKRIERDRQDFHAARLLFLNIQKEILGLESKINNRDSVLRAAGKPMAASISAFLAIILICAAVLRSLFAALFL
ncbi:MAG: serine/threonine protein kinase [Alphaproteobacteria bacterium]|nr:serine/threonine protein kinase [Alphaproteobacteria bacterium]